MTGPGERDAPVSSADLLPSTASPFHIEIGEGPCLPEFARGGLQRADVVSGDDRADEGFPR